MARNTEDQKRFPSIQQAIHDIEADDQHHLTGHFIPRTPRSSEISTSNDSHVVKKRPHDDSYDSKGLWKHIKTLRWMRVPSSSFKLLIIPIFLYSICALLNGWLDIPFIVYHVVVFSFIRQFLLLKVIFPVARMLRIRKRKLDRFGEQSYAMLYYGVMGFWGAYIMSTLPTWWYHTEYYWIDYPHWDMKPVLKRYYLMHFSYWIHQLLVLALKIENPRKDFRQLVAHHIVTLWLIGWSYGINLTLIGNGIFVSMDIPDVFLALSILCNYLKLGRTKKVVFGVFMIIWTCFRHFLNIVILYSVWAQFSLIPAVARFFRPLDGVWMVWWMKYQIFVPLLLLQFLNLFWYYYMVRILIRAVTEPDVSDIRSDDEDEGEEKDD